MITKESIQEVINKLDIVDVIGSFIKLKKRGVNYIGHCPFHNEKTPSFTVSPSKEIYKCFGCGKSGNTISFVMEHEKYSYVEAIRWLANRYNITLVETEVSAEQKEQFAISDSLFIINNFAVSHFTKNLLETEEGKSIGYSYFEERGFTRATIEKFQLGYAFENRTNFSDAAIAAQFNKEYLVKTGLVVERDGSLIDNYRGRVIFPIHNQSGKVLGFGARILKTTDKAPKYINTPQNEIYDKSKILYGLYFARTSIDKNNECLLVEGYTDVISLYQAGVENVVASGGTSLTVDQLRLIKKFTKNLTILYDGDAAGVKAALRGLDLALEAGLHVNVVLIPDGHDPDSYVQLVGADAFKDFIKDNKEDVILFQLRVSMQSVGNDSTAKANLVNQIAETISKINRAEDFTRQQDYIKRSADVLKIDEAGLMSLVNKFIREKIGKPDYNKPEKKEQDFNATPLPDIDDDATLTLLYEDEMQERNIARVLIEFGNKQYEEGGPFVADYLLNKAIDLDMFDNKDIADLILLYKREYENGSIPDQNFFIYHEDQKIAATVISLIDFPYQISNRWKEKFDITVPTKEDTYKQDIDSSIMYLHLKKIRKFIKKNQEDLEKVTDPEEQAIILETQKILKEQEMALVAQMKMVVFSS